MPCPSILAPGRNDPVNSCLVLSERENSSISLCTSCAPGTLISTFWNFQKCSGILRTCLQILLHGRNDPVHSCLFLCERKDSLIGAQPALNHKLFGILQSVLELLGHACQSQLQAGMILLFLFNNVLEKRQLNIYMLKMSTRHFNFNFLEF